MRAPDFWDRDDLGSRLTRAVLTPIGSLYGATVRWKAKHATPYRAPIPVICIGNISAGGTGKTPIAIAITDALCARGHKPAFLSRGYGGRLKGPVFVTNEHSAADVGDEPLLLARSVPTVVAQDRRAGAERIATSGANVIVMDDGHQNFSLAKDISIVVVDGEAGFGNGHVLPAGPLRETAEMGLSRADAVVVMGDGNPDLYNFNGPIFRAHLRPHLAEDWRGRHVLAFAGIGRPQKFFRTLEQTGAVLAGVVPFPDHYAFTSHDLARIKAQARDQNAQLITTEKDFVRVPKTDRGEIAVLPVRADIEPRQALDRLLDRLVPPR